MTIVEWSRIPNEDGGACQCRPGDAGKLTMRVRKDELRLMSAGEVWGDSDGLPAKKNKEPEHDVEKEGGKDKHANIDTPFGSPDGQCCAYMTCKHGGLLGGKSLTFDTSGRLRLTVGCPINGRVRRLGLAKEHNRISLLTFCYK